jgi:glycolate oxidase
LKSNFKNIDSSFLSVLERICGKDYVQVGSSINELYGRDEALKRIYKFDYLVKPSCELEIAEIVKACNKYDVPITPRGGGSGVSGGAIPINGGIILSTERLNRIIEINTLNKVVIAECGVITDVLCEKVKEKGLYFPIRPSSGFMSFIGGNVAENSGSINSLKYGSTKDYVLNLQVVLPNGEIIWTGANTTKNSTGPNITQLFVGSEGILGIITKIVFKLIPIPQHEFTLMAEFSNINELCYSIDVISKSNLSPSAIELIDEFSANLTSKFLTGKAESHKKAHLLINFDGNSQELLDEEMLNCYNLIKNSVCGEVLIAKTFTEKENLWKIRMNIGVALIQGNKVYRDIDIAVPISKLHEFIRFVNKISKQKYVKIACFGHAGNGNLHTMISVDKQSDLENNNVKEAIDQIYKTGIEMGGTISGEHGIGILQKKYMPLQYNQAYLNLIREIKKTFDPRNLINPGKII